MADSHAGGGRARDYGMIKCWKSSEIIITMCSVLFIKRVESYLLIIALVFCNDY